MRRSKYFRTHHNIELYIQENDKFKAARNMIKNGVGYYLLDGKWVKDREFFEENGIPNYEYPSPDNPDGTNIPTGTVPYKKPK